MRGLLGVVGYFEQYAAERRRQLNFLLESVCQMYRAFRRTNVQI